MNDIDNLIDESAERLRGKPTPKSSPSPPSQRVANDGDVIDDSSQRVTDDTRQPISKMRSNPLRDAANWVVNAGLSFGKMAYDTLKGVPGIPKALYNLAKEFANIKELNKGLDGLYSNYYNDKIDKWDAYRYRGLVEKYPIVMGGFFDVMDTWGDPMDIEGFQKALVDARDMNWSPRGWDEFEVRLRESWKRGGVKQTLKEDPARLAVDVLPVASAFLKTAKLAKMAKILDTIDPQNLPGNIAGGALKSASKRFAKDPGAYNPTMTSKYGQDASGDLETKRPAVDLAEDYGAGKDQAPMHAVTDSEFAHLFEEGVRKTETGNVTEGIRQRDTITRRALRDTQERFVEQLAQGKVDPAIDFRNPEVAGEMVVKNYNEIISGKRLTIGDRFTQNNEILNQPFTLPIENLFSQTRAEIERLIQKDPGTRKAISNPDLQKSVRIFDRLLSNLQKKAEEGTITIEHINNLQTSYHQRMDVFKNKGMLVETGKNSVSKIIYHKIVDDFYNLLENEVNTNPDNFPPNFIDTIQLTKREWAELRDLDGSDAANFLRNNQKTPSNIIEAFTRDNSKHTEKFMTDLKTLIGVEGMDALKPALLNRIFQKSLIHNLKTGEKDISPTGLRTILDKINEGNPNRVRNLFGDEMASSLFELANFTRRAFAKRGEWNTPTLNKFFQDHLNNPKLHEAFFSTYMVGETGQGIYMLMKQSGYDVSQLMPSALQVGISLGLWAGLKGRRALLLSDVGRQWMLEGYSIDMNIGNRTITIDGPSLLLAGEFIQKHWKNIGRIALRTERAESRSENLINKMPFDDPDFKIGYNPLRLPTPSGLKALPPPGDSNPFRQ